MADQPKVPNWYGMLTLVCRKCQAEDFSIQSRNGVDLIAECVECGELVEGGVALR